MARSTGKPFASPLAPAIADLKVKVPTIDELMWPPLPRWWEFLPPPTPKKNDGPYAPVPIVPPLPPPPREVDPPSRPPESLFGPPYISKAAVQVPSPGPSYAQFVPLGSSTAAGGLAERIAALKGGLLRSEHLSSSGVFDTGAPSIPVPVASQRAPRGLPAMLAEVGAFDSPNPDSPPSGGLPGMIQEYLRNR